MTNGLKLLPLVSGMAVALTGCGGGGDSTPTPPPVTTYQVTATAGTGGTLSPTSATVNSGANTTFTVTANSGYAVSSVTGCGGTLSGSTYTTGMVADNCTVTASFVAQYAVTGTAGAGGTISPASVNVNSGSTTTLTVTPNTGYAISGVTGCGGSLTGTSYTTGAVSAACTVTATFLPQRGTLMGTPTLTATLSASQLTTLLNSNSYGQELLALAAGTMPCGVNVYHVDYWTVAPDSTGADSQIHDSTALMVPTGSGAQCSGGFPIVIDAHGSASDQVFNMANVNADPIGGMAPLTGSIILAALYAAQGYVVVAPNYASYDTSNFPSRLFLEADQNSKDMIDALAASKSAMSSAISPAVTFSSKLFVSGYSEGGFVAMATDKALQAAGVTVTATALMSGIYTTEANYDMVFTGRAGFGTHLAFETYQIAYGNIPQTTDVFTSLYLGNPGLGLFDFNLAPPSTGNAQVDALLQPTAQYSGLFGFSYAIADSFRQSYVQDMLAHPDGAVPTQTAGVPMATNVTNVLRQDAQRNDMRSWTPTMPMLLCGGHQDRTVLFDINAQAMMSYWSAQVTNGILSLLDVDTAPSQGAPYAAVQTGFQQQESQNETSMGQPVALSVYHLTVIPFCEAAGRQFFGKF